MFCVIAIFYKLQLEMVLNRKDIKTYNKTKVPNLNKKDIKAYNETRISLVNKKVICHAPWQSINFTQNGNATVCCYNNDYVLGTYPKHSIRDIWFGKTAQALRSEMRKNPLPNGCQICALQIESENYASVHARHYDFHSDHPVKHWFKKVKNYFKQKKYIAYPRVIEFELSNTCNLECVMCNGYFSSSIRKNRENLPPMKMVFDELFVEQLNEFIPHLTDAKFLGGEPFLIPIYQKIWAKIIELNPSCKVHITTNATIISDKNWNTLERLTAVIIVSIDSINPITYNKIRKGASWSRVAENIEKLHQYTIDKKTDLNFSVCPMTNNWEEIPEIIQYGIDNKIYIYFNTVIFPENLSLKNIDKEFANEIVLKYENYVLDGDGFYYEYNKKQLIGLINLIKFWHSIV